MPAQSARSSLTTSDDKSKTTCRPDFRLVASILFCDNLIVAKLRKAAIMIRTHQSLLLNSLVFAVLSISIHNAYAVGLASGNEMRNTILKRLDELSRENSQFFYDLTTLCNTMGFAGRSVREVDEALIAAGQTGHIAFHKDNKYMGPQSRNQAGGGFLISATPISNTRFNIVFNVDLSRGDENATVVDVAKCGVRDSHL